MSAPKPDTASRQAFLDALGELAPHDQEEVLLKASAMARRVREPCPCESGELFGACHGRVE